MILLRRFVPLLALIPVFAGCGSHAGGARTPTPRAASVAGTSITYPELDTYLRYANRFFSAAYPGTVKGAGMSCGAAKVTAACAAVRKQVLARLIQQQVVRQYAQQHHIFLSASDERKVNQELKLLLDPSSDTADLYDHSPRTRRFLRQVLETQNLVLKVENAVVGPRAARGFAYHLEKVSIPGGKQGNREALNLSTDGKPLPLDASVRDEWEAPFRLDHTVAQAVSSAKNGEYVGPFPRSGGYLVVHVLGSGLHRYGRPARTFLLTRLFRAWLRDHVRAAHPRCDQGPDAPACSMAMMKGS